jgi:hypothetical protein
MKYALTRIPCKRGRHRGPHHLPRVRIQEGRGDAAGCLPALLPLCTLRCASTAAGRRLLRVLLVLGSALPADAGGLGLAERAAFGLKPSLVLGRHRRMESPGDVPAKRAAKGAALTDALRRAAAAKAGWVVYASDEAHGRILRREGSRATNDRNRRNAYRSDFLRWADTAEIKPGTLDFLFEFVTRLSERQGAGGASAQVGAPERAG